MQRQNVVYTISVPSHSLTYNGRSQNADDWRMLGVSKEDP